MQSLVNSWYESHPALNLLSPIATVYRGIVKIRRHCYQRQLFKSTNFPVPVIIVGNLSVGGSGKTPLVIWLAKLLQLHGYKPGIVSRGYGGRVIEPCPVYADSDPSLVGDEPVLMARRSQCPIVVCPKRVAAVEYLLAEYECNIVISDDGLQHYALARDVEIAVLDGQRRYGNEKCLPAGPLREPLSRLKQVDFIVNNGAEHSNENSMNLNIGVPLNVANPGVGQDLDNFKNKTIHAVAGIGNPQRFFYTLRDLGLSIKPHAFKDHHCFKPNDIDFGEDALVLMTEKDAVKCQRFADQRHWFIPVDAQLSPDFAQQLLRVIQR